ncbi:MAG: hypothetical protein RL358_1659 [Pseudomonadota bacterium]
METAPQLEMLIFDSSAYTRSLLLECLARLAECSLHAHEVWAERPLEKLLVNASVVVLNHHVNFCQSQSRACQPS